VGTRHGQKSEDGGGQVLPMPEKSEISPSALHGERD